MKTKVADLESLTDGKAHSLKVGETKLCLIRVDGTVHAIENRCPHLGLPLGKGRIENGQIVCPFHGSRFSIATGECTDWVAAIAGMKLPQWSSAMLSFGKKPQPVRTFPVVVEGQDVFVVL
jgi:nitrite reductase/ring-hydroxylating ferredoxin subunit